MDVFNLFILLAILMGIYTYYEGIEFSSLIIYLSLFALLILYFGGKQYLREGFDDAEALEASRNGTAVVRSKEVPLGTTDASIGTVTGNDEDVAYVDEATGAVSDKPIETPVNMDEIAKPFATSPINSLAEYDDPVTSEMLLSDLNPDGTELDAVATNEGERSDEMSRAIKNQQMFNRKFEWSNNLPPSSIVQQIQQSKWNATLNETAAPYKMAGTEAEASADATADATAEGFANKKKAAKPLTPPKHGKPSKRAKKAEGFVGSIGASASAAPLNQLKASGDNYSAVDGSSMQPVDLDKLEAEERAILQTFNPTRSASELGTYNVQDVAELLDKYYTKQGKRASFYKREDGVYEVFETEELKPKIEWEDENDQPERAEEGKDMTGEINVPKGVAEYSAKLDPFFEPRQSTRPNRADYTAWTPGLERMFAPTEPTQQWY